MKQVWLNSTQWFRRRLGDGQMDRQQMHRRTDTQKNNVALTHLAIKGSDVACFVDFCPVV